MYPISEGKTAMFLANNCSNNTSYTISMADNQWAKLVNSVGLDQTSAVCTKPTTTSKKCVYTRNSNSVGMMIFDKDFNFYQDSVNMAL